MVGRPPEAVRRAVELVMESHRGLGKLLFPRETSVGTIELGVAFGKE